MQEGTYLLEINTVAGAAIVNRPIYVGVYPLLPDFRDLKQYASSHKMDYQKLLQDYLL